VNRLDIPVRAALWWLLPLAGLAAVIGWETDWGRAVEKQPKPPEAIAPKPVVTSLLPEFAIEGGVSARTATVERTLFNPTRRPAPPAVQEAAAMRLKPGQFALTGTLVVEGKSTAYLREVATNKSQRVRAGEKVNGMLVAEIRPDRVKLTLGGESEELVLKVATNPRPTAPPVAVARTATQPAAAVPPAGAAPAAPAGTPSPAQTLAERRRAARAAAAAAAAADGSGAATSPPAAGAPANAAPAAAAPSATGIDPRWGQMDQRYGERATRANRPVTK
jgi:hypothetical protein